MSGYMQAHSYRIPDNQKLVIGNNQAAKLQLNKTLLQQLIT